MSSKDYWKKREAENLKSNLKKEQEYEREIIRIYQNMFDDIINEINSFYGKYARAENITLAEAKRRVSKLDIEAYERKAKRYVKDRNFSKKANEEMRLYNLTMKINRLEMLKANIALELISGYDQVNTYMDNILNERAMEEFERQAGILGKTVGNNAKYAHSIVNASFHNATFSDRIWTHQEILKAELSKLLQRGLIQGKGSSELARELRKTVKASVSDANRLMRTELARVQTEANKQSMLNNGSEEYKFMTLGSCCDICAGLDGKHFKIKDMVIGENAPPMHPNCRCTVTDYVDREEYEEWLEFVSNGGTTEEWEKLRKKNIPSSKAPKDEGLKIYTKQDIEKMASRMNDIANKYIDNESKWSGKIVVDDNANKYGKMWNCDIITRRETAAHILLHEQIHAHSVSYYDERTYFNYQRIEEASVELMAQEISSKENITIILSNYENNVKRLRYLNQMLNINKTDYIFAKKLIEKPLNKRLDWLEELAYNYMKNGGTIGEYQKISKIIESLRNL